MIKFWKILVLFLFLPFLGCGKQNPDEVKPKLVILLAIDQFPAWYLEDYAPALRGGLKTLTAEGRYFPTAWVNHAPTLSGAGHGSLATGLNPAKHGFAANEWWVQLADGTYSWQSIFADQRYHFVGLPGDEQFSPKNLTAPPLSEWFLESSPEARVLNVGLSEVTLLYAARSPANAFWFSEQYGVFGTSTFYANELPGWVTDFNAGFLQDFMRENRTWTLAVPKEFRGLAEPDASPYEAGGENFTFPHNPPEDAVFKPIPDASFPEEENPEEANEAPPAMHNWLYNSPYMDIALLEFAKAGIENMELGRDGTPDLLTIAMNSADNIGHRYGPNSLEVLDYLMRLDAALGDFIAYLDENFGREGYVLALSSDHGVAPAPELTMAQGGEARRLTFAEIDAALDELENFIAAYDGEREDFPEALAQELEKIDFIAEAMTRSDLEGEGPADQHLGLYRNGHVTGKTTDFPLWGASRQLHPALFGLEVRFPPNTVFEAATGIHGSSYDYDRRVPVIFFGGLVIPGISGEEPNTTDVAPTLARLAGIRVPEEVDGKILEVGN